MKFRFITILTILFCSFIYAQDHKTDFDKLKDLDVFIDSLLVQWDVPGLSIAVVSEDTTIYSKGFGIKNVETKERVNDSTLFSIASSTKSFTTSLATILSDEGIIDLDKPVNNLDPELEWYNDDLTKHVTLRDMMTHRTGIPRQKFFTLNILDRPERVLKSLKYFEPTNNLRYKFSYSNEMYTIAGELMSRITGKSWKELISEKILNPLGMNNTLFSMSEINNKSNFASPYIDWGDGIEPLDLHNADMLAAAGAMISNVKDLSKWVSLWINRWNINGQPLLPTDKVVAMLAPQTPITTFTRDKEIINQSYGLGWFVESYRGHLHIHHGGVLYGYTSLVSFLPREKYGIVILCNMNNTKVPEILARTIYDKLLELEDIDWNKRAYDYFQRVIAYYEKLELDEKSNQKEIQYDAAKYVGHYQSDGYGELFVKQEADSLVTEMLGYKCPLKALDKDVFGIYHPVEHMSFNTVYKFDDNGEVTGFEFDLLNGANPVFFSNVR